ncbi:MAG TPA: periplasmic heavy metal sensor [Bacteroidota bacterium]|jgi:Spy/CpxP family protein refolding chaperone|nr:periplasmic heavy metal sensor [Bacteroidota bacterium]
MKMKILVGALVFLILVNLATIGSFVYFRFMHHPPPMMPGMEGPFHGPPPFRNMDEAQRNKVMALMESLRSETEELNVKASEIERHTFDLLQRNPAPEDSIDRNLQELSAVRLMLSRKVTKKFLEAKSFLTTEQQRMLFEEMGRGHHGPPGERRERRGMGGRDMPPPPDPPPDH